MVSGNGGRPAVVAGRLTLLVVIDPSTESEPVRRLLDRARSTRGGEVIVVLDGATGDRWQAGDGVTRTVDHAAWPQLVADLADGPDGWVLVVPAWASHDQVDVNAHATLGASRDAVAGPGERPDVVIDRPGWWDVQPEPATVAALSFRGFSVSVDWLSGPNAAVAFPFRSRSSVTDAFRRTDATVAALSDLAGDRTAGAPSWGHDAAERLAREAVDIVSVDPSARPSVGLSPFRRVAYPRLLRRRLASRLDRVLRLVGADRPWMLDGTFWATVRRLADEREPALGAGVPILMYHAFGVGESSRYVVDRRIFRRHLAVLRLLRRRVVSLDDLVDARERHEALPARATVITIDDGYADVYTVAGPELERRGLTATLFVPSDLVATRCTWSTEPALQDRPLADWPRLRGGLGTISVGSHSTRHRAMTDLSPPDVEWEFVESARQLETALGRPVTTFAYPFGSRNRETDEVARRSSYRAVCTSSGGLNLPDEPLHRLRRVEVRGDRGLLAFTLAVLTGRSMSGSRPRAS